MYEIVHTKAIIFLERREKEYDKVFFIFSEALGLTSVTAPGILKPMAKLNSLLQPFRTVTADVIVGKHTKKITTIIEYHSFEHLFTQKETKESILRIFEFITTMVPRNVPVPELYDLFESYLHALEKMMTHNMKGVKQAEIQILYAILRNLGYVSDESMPLELVRAQIVEQSPLRMHKTLLHRVNTILKEIQT